MLQNPNNSEFQILIIIYALFSIKNVPRQTIIKDPWSGISPTTQDIKDKCFIADYSIETESELKNIRALLDIETKIGSVYIMYTY